jgi:diguanylate cyclase (GGDEF)-like protein
MPATMATPTKTADVGRPVRRRDRISRLSSRSFVPNAPATFAARRTPTPPRQSSRCTPVLTKRQGWQFSAPRARSTSSCAQDFLTRPGSLIASGLSGATAIALAAAAAWRRTRRDADRWTQPLAAGLVAAAAINAEVVALIAQDARPTAFTMLAVVLAGGLIVGSGTWYAGTLAVVCLGWLGVALVTGADDDWAIYVLGLVAAGVMSWLVRTIRLGDLDAAVRAQERADAAAVTDPLTGLANRQGLAMLGAQIVEAARRQGDAAHCLVIDVDELAAVNEKHGHEVRDEVIAGVAAAVRAVTRGTDIVARWSGGEFYVVGPGSGMPPMELERRARDQLLAHEAVDTGLWDPRLTVGAAVLAPWDAGTLDTLIAAANQQMRHRRSLRRQGKSAEGRQSSRPR